MKYAAGYSCNVTRCEKVRGVWILWQDSECVSAWVPLCISFIMKGKPRTTTGARELISFLCICSVAYSALYTNSIPASFCLIYTHTHTHSQVHILSSACFTMTHPARPSAFGPLNRDDDMCTFLSGAPQPAPPHLWPIEGKPGLLHASGGQDWCLRSNGFLLFGLVVFAFFETKKKKKGRSMKARSFRNKHIYHG